MFPLCVLMFPSSHSLLRIMIDHDTGQSSDCNRTTALEPVSMFSFERLTLFSLAARHAAGVPQGIFRSLVGGVNDMVATTAGITKTQEALLATSRGLLEGAKVHGAF